MNDIAHFLDMGGYAIYVWSAYGIVLAVLAANVAEPLLRQRRLLRRIAQQTAESDRAFHRRTAS